jgi:p-hydroxybenzoate 3-monooxygenase
MVEKYKFAAIPSIVVPGRNPGGWRQALLQQWAGCLRTQVVIVGAGPSGLLLSQLLRRAGIDSIVLERQSREYVAGRIRAGLLEWGSVELISDAGAGERMMQEGLVHDGFELVFADRQHRIDLKRLTGRQVLVYGQTELQHDLAAAAGDGVCYEAKDVALQFADRAASVCYTLDGRLRQIECDFIAGCDGYHGVSRTSVPREAITLHERVYPFGWLGLLADVPPVHDELVYVNHRRGFALCSMRSPTRSRYYLQCALTDRVEDWSDERFWNELRARLPRHYAEHLQTGQSLEKSIVPLRSCVAEPMRFGRLFLVGDAAHIVPPTGAKGLNLAAADVRVLNEGFVQYYRSGRAELLDQYSARALSRVWKATRFSWWFTTLMHQVPGEEFSHKLQLAELDYLSGSKAASQAVAENYAGLPF